MVIGSIMEKEYIVNAFWDNEAQVWVAESDDVPGLITEAATLEKLVEKLRILIPELLLENGSEHEQEMITFHLVSDWKEQITITQ
jgi:predicted RNase H-like HicB family nuclease